MRVVLRASSAPRVIACPGSYRIAPVDMQRDNSAAELGTLAASVAAAALIERRELSSFLSAEVDQEMIHGLALYVGHIFGLMGDAKRPERLVEFPLKLDIGHADLTGTPDFFIRDPKTGILYVRDLKWGFGWVEAEGNCQLLQYAWMAMAHINAPVDVVNLGIVQPRASHPEGPIRTWVMTYQEFWEKCMKMDASIKAAAKEDAPLNTGPQCRDCRGMLRCHAASERRGAMLELSRRLADSQPLDLREAATQAEIMRAICKTLDNQAASLEEYVIQRVAAGHRAPEGYEVRQKIGSLAWAYPNVAIQIGDAMGVDLRAPEAPITPTQAIARGIIKETTASELAVRAAGKMEIKPVNIKRARRILNV